jgi:hypothetical protein
MFRLRCAACAILLSTVFASIAPGQRPFRPGEEIEFKLRGQWMPGRVLRVMPDGKSVQVRAIINGRPQPGVVPLEDVRPAGGEAEKQPAEPEPAVARTWSDSTGKFKIEAVYLAQEGGGVKLLKSDGAVISVPLAKLSEADQEYVASRANMPAAPQRLKVGDAVEAHWRAVKWYPGVIRQVDGDRYLIHYDNYSDAFDEWFDAKDVRPRAAPASNVVSSGEPSTSETADATPAKPLQTGYTTCDVTKSAPTPIDSQAAAPSGVAPDPGPAGTMPEGGFALRKMEFFEKPAGMLPANADAGLLLLAFADKPPGKPGATQFAVYDLSGAVVSEVRYTGMHRLLAAGGAWLITTGEEHANPPQYRIWKRPDLEQPPEPGYELKMQADVHSPFAVNISRAWVSGDLAVLQTEGNRVILWGLSQQRIEASWEASRAAVSSGGKYLAVLNDKGIAVIDLASRKQIGFWGLGSASVTALEFSPQGTSLACLFQSELKVFDLKTGKIRFDNSLPPSAGSVTLGPPVWCNEDQVIIGKQHLVDVNVGFVVWKYNAQASLFGVPEMLSCGGKVCYLADRYGSEPAHVRSVTLPHEAVKTALASVDPREIYALTPGGSVALQVNAGAEAGAIRQALEKRIAENGWKLAADSPIRIIATVKPGEARTETFTEGLSGAGAATSVTFRPMISEVDLQVNGESAWATATETFLPGILMSKSGQSTQDAVRAYEKPDISFFANLPLPRQIVKPQHQEGLGSSQLTGAGVVDGR